MQVEPEKCMSKESCCVRSLFSSRPSSHHSFGECVWKERKMWEIKRHWKTLHYPEMLIFFSFFCWKVFGTLRCWTKKAIGQRRRWKKSWMRWRKKLFLCGWRATRINQLKKVFRFIWKIKKKRGYSKKKETETLRKSIKEQHKRIHYIKTQSSDEHSLLSFNMLIKHSSRVFNNFSCDWVWTKY